LLTYKWSEEAEGLNKNQIVLACRLKESFIGLSASLINKQFTSYFDVLKGAAKE